MLIINFLFDNSPYAKMGVQRASEAKSQALYDPSFLLKVS